MSLMAKLKKQGRRFLILFSLSILSATSGLWGCQSIPAPIKEYSLAKSAMEAAKAVQAPRHSPGYWSRADELFRRARILYKEREYVEARELFTEARIAAEKAENSARLIRQKNGDIL